MAIAPITGKLRKRLIFDLSFSIGSGVIAAYTYWYGYHVPSVRKREAFYAKLEEQRLAAAA